MKSELKIKTVQTRGKKVASTALTITSTTVVNINVQPQVLSVKSRQCFTLSKYIPQENQRDIEQ